MELAVGIPFLNAQLVDVSLLLLRLIIATVYLGSGWAFVARGKSDGMSRPLAIFIGSAQMAGALGLLAGVLLQFAAAGLILVMLGAAYKKMFVWKTGFWGTSSQGWHYDLLFIAADLVILATDGGRFILWK